MGAAVTAVVVAWRHQSNLRRLWAGTERRLRRSTGTPDA
jgi:glycerol-3-phosphate acyltransferase PlsY